MRHKVALKARENDYTILAATRRNYTIYVKISETFYKGKVRVLLLHPPVMTLVRMLDYRRSV